MKLKVKNQLTVTRIAILGTKKLNTWKSNELDLIALRLGQLRSDQRVNYQQLTLFDLG